MKSEFELISQVIAYMRESVFNNLKYLSIYGSECYKEEAERNNKPETVDEKRNWE